MFKAMYFLPQVVAGEWRVRLYRKEHLSGQQTATHQAHFFGFEGGGTS